MHASIFQFCTVTFEPCSEFHIMMDQFRIPMQHLELYKMEAIFKALWNVFMLVFKSFFSLATLDYNVSEWLYFKTLSLNIMDFKLASAPKNLSLRWTAVKSLHLKASNVFLKK